MEMKKRDWIFRNKSYAVWYLLKELGAKWVRKISHIRNKNNDEFDLKERTFLLLNTQRKTDFFFINLYFQFRGLNSKERI